MKVIPIASDSLGVRSLAVYVETKDCKIFIDASAELGPIRYSLPPAKEELEELAKTKEKISKLAEKCDIITISHYHYDHYDENAEYYKDKVVYAKDSKENINQSQMQRAKVFFENFNKKCNLIYCDGKEFMHGKTKIKFSQPFHHGDELSKLGYVVMCEVIEDFGKDKQTFDKSNNLHSVSKNIQNAERKSKKLISKKNGNIKKFLHASDVQGPICEDATGYILKENPDLVVIDGSPTIFLGYKFSVNDLKRAKNNLLKIAKNLDGQIILDHHLLRDKNYKKHFAEVYSLHSVKTFAEFLGKENNMLEAQRKELWRKSR